MDRLGGHSDADQFLAVQRGGFGAIFMIGAPELTRLSTSNTALFSKVAPQ